MGNGGKGKVPHYRIEEVGGCYTEREEAHVLGVFNGRTHKLMAEQSRTDVSWSKDEMFIEEVAELFREVEPFGVTPFRSPHCRTGRESP